MNGTIICNPNAGKLKARERVEHAAEIFRSAGWEITLQFTDGPGDATGMAREAVAAGLDVAIVAGGDGTLNEAIQALAHSETALAYLPFGTVNVWAREIGIPLELEGAARAIVDGRIERFDLGVAGDRYFLLMAGIGFDGEVLRRSEGLVHHKARLGVLLYTAIGLITASTYRGADIELRYDGVIRRVQALMLVVGNTRLYGGRFYLTPKAVANDGWLDLCVLKGRGPLALARQALPLGIFGSVTHADVELLRVKELTVQADHPLPMQLDGELTGTTPMQFGVASRALHAVVPQHFTSSLIA